ncbi:MAG: hypothetical protein AB1671_10545 [Thermodesulfobacteriota bacterium]|jgi:hypothetical protein
MRPQLQNTFLGVTLAAVLLTFGACASGHSRFHRNLEVVHDEFHRRPHSPAEHRRLHEALDELHDEYHDRDRYRDPYYGGGFYYPDRY